MEQNIAQYGEKVKRYYDAAGKLAQYPSKKPLRILVLMQLAQGLEPEREYTEKEVNELIRERIVFGDIELIRRELFQYGFINRLKDGSQYWLEEDWRERYREYVES